MEFFALVSRPGKWFYIIKCRFYVSEDLKFLNEILFSVSFTVQGPDFRCGGTIINERYILTAAHCISSNRDVLSGVRVGEHNIQTETDCEGTGESLVCADQYQDFGIEEILAHPEFDVRGRQNDIGLLRLDRNIDFTRSEYFHFYRIFMIHSHFDNF